MIPASKQDVAGQLADALNARGERRLHRHSWLFVIGHLLWQNSIPLAFLVFTNRDWLGDAWPWIALAAAVLTLFAIVHFLTYRFAIRDGDIVIRHGIFFRRTRYVPLAKVHNVTVRRNLLHRALGVAEVILESGGSGQSAEAHLRVLSLADARACERLVNHQPLLHADEDKPLPDDNVLPLRRRDIVRYGLANDQGVLWGAVLSVFLLTDDAVRHWLSQQVFFWLLGMRAYDGPTLLMLGGLFVLGSLLVGKAMTVLLAFFTHGHFYLGDSDTHITLRRGVLTRVESHMPKSRIQAWRIRANPVHRLFGCYSVHIDSVVMPGDSSRGIRELIPIASHATTRRLLARWMDADPLAQTLLPLHAKAARRIALRYILWLALILLPLMLLTETVPMPWRRQDNAWIALAGVLLCAACVVAAKQRCRFAGWALAQGALHWRDGWWWRRHHVAEVARIRALRLQHNPLDRRYDMVHLDADTLGAAALTAPLRLRFLPQAQARALLAQLQAKMREHT